MKTKNFFKWLCCSAILLIACVQTMDAGTKRIYCKMDKSWWTASSAAISVHYWGGSATGTTWPGKRMTNVSGTSNIWYYDIPDNVGNFCFARVNSSGDIADWGAKTEDLSFNGDNNLYTISNTTECWSGSSCKCGGSWGMYYATPVVCGSWDGWSGKTELGNSIHLAAGSYTFKVIDGESVWHGATVEGATMTRNNCSDWSLTGDKNCGITADVEGDYTFSGSASKLSVTYPSTTTRTIYLDLSSFTDWEKESATFQVWDNNGDHNMTRVSDCDNHVYSAMVNVIDTKYSFKRIKNGGTDKEHKVTLTSEQNAYKVKGWDSGEATTFTPTTYQISFAAGGGSGEMSAITGITCGASQKITTNGFTAPTGKIFDNWKDGNGTTYADRATITNIKANITLTAQWKEELFTIQVESNNTEYGTVGGSSVQAGALTSVQLPTATKKSDEYKFVEWTATDGITITNSTSATSATIKATKAGTITANFALAATYDLSVEAGTGISEVGGGKTGQISPDFTSTVTAVVKTGFNNPQWSKKSGDGNVAFSNETYTHPDASATATVTGGSVAVIVNATEIMSSLTAGANEIGASVEYSVTGANNIGVETTATLVATTPGTGYKFEGWSFNNCTRTDDNGDKSLTITVKGTGNGEAATVTANYAEDLSTPWNLNIGIQNEAFSHVPFVKESGSSTGSVAYATIELQNGKTYKFNYYTGTGDNKTYKGPNNESEMPEKTQWTFTGSALATFSTSIAGTYKFKIDYSGNNPTAIYYKPSVNALHSNFTGSWARTDGTVTNGVLTVNYEITQAMVDSKFDLEFEMIYDGTYYGPGIDKTEMTVNNHTDWELSPSTGHHVVLKPSVAGQYTFVFTEEGAKLDVTYPAPPTYTVTMAVDGPGTTTPAESVELNAFTGTEITATPTEHSGYHFKNWTGTDGITFADANAATTTAKATGTGTITAHFEKDTYIYFNNTIAQKWKDSPLYIYLYKGDGYWDEKTGTGAAPNGNYMGRFEMTKLPNTEIWSWHYDQLHSFQDGDKITYVAFSDKDMDGYQNFYDAEATYKSYNDCMNMFVPDASQTPKPLNNTDYYNDGFWRRYNDEHSKMYLHIWDVKTGTEVDGAGYELKTKTAGNDAFNATVKLENSHQYNIYIGSCDGKNFSRETTIASDKCSGIQLFNYGSIDDKSRLAYLQTAAGGNYVFTLTYDKDKMTLSVEYPVTANDYRVKTGTPTRYSNIIRSTEPSGTISMFLNAGINTLTYEEATDINVDPIVWGNTKSINVNVANAGVYTMTLTKGASPTITNVQPYTGKYYVRTDCAQGGWNEYKTNDNNLMRYTDRQPDYEDNPATGFNYYYCRWNENAEGNVRFVIANEINPCISDTLKEDAILDDTEFLKGKANIRFSWNSNTNALNRAYISGSYDDAEYLQIRSVGNKLFKKQDESEPITDAKLDDNNDWTYIIDVYADGQARAAVSAKYNNKYQFFVGTGNAETGAVTETILVIEDASKAHMQLVYDFKTDRIVTGWIPGGVITENITLQSDAILTRVHQGQLSPIKFSVDGISVLKVQTMYGVLQLDKATMTDGHTQDPDKIYERNIYWISFPFDVRVGDIFGVDGYGEKWVMQRYNGAKRAEIGWFAETATFWEYMDQNDIMEANVGYTLTLDPDYFDNASDAMWANSKTSVSFYFPSVTHNIDVVSNGQAKSSIPAHECKIDRMFDDGKKNHKTTDSHWNVIGIPTFQDLENPSFDVQSVYKWNPANNTYSIQALADFTLEASYAYFVQWGREELVTWPNASIIKPKAPYKYADAKNYMVDLYFSYGDKEDHTYINLKDEAKADFVLNEDMMKVINSGQPNIYSYAGAYDVAYNATAFENQTVNLGVIARKNGSYTFAMPKDFSGKAVLVDLESGEATDLNLSNYTVELNKGTYNNRFQLVLEVEAKAPTNMNPTKGEWSEDGKTKKLFINDNIYLINGGRVYNVLGARP